MARSGANCASETSVASSIPAAVAVPEAATGTEAAALAVEHRPDVALVDLQLPGIDGVEVIRRFAQAAPPTRVVVLTSYQSDSDVFAALRAGTLSYLLKDVGPDDLAAAIRAAVADESVLHPRIASRVVASLHGPRGDVPDAFRELTDRDLEVLRLLGEGLSNARIAEHLVIGDKTVKTHVSSILSKLQLDDRTAAPPSGTRPVSRRPVVRPGRGAGRGRG